MAAASPQEEVNRYFRVRKTLTEMLRDRGYVVSPDDLEMTFAKFQDSFGRQLASIGQGEYAKDLPFLMLFAAKESNPNEKVLVFFPVEESLGVSILRGYHNEMHNQNVRNAIIVYRHKITSFSLKIIPKARESGINMEFFKQAELLVNITKHKLVPTHIPLNNEEKQALLKTYKLKDQQLPRISRDDPVARYFGLTRGQVVKIIRNSETAGRYVTYRLCD